VQFPPIVPVEKEGKITVEHKGREYTVKYKQHSGLAYFQMEPAEGEAGTSNETPASNGEPDSGVSIGNSLLGKPQENYDMPDFMRQRGVPPAMVPKGPEEPQSGESIGNSLFGKKQGES
jgi:hypothetical protein